LNRLPLAGGTYERISVPAIAQPYCLGQGTLTETTALCPMSTVRSAVWEKHFRDRLDRSLAATYPNDR
jgi:hypothetical protein